MDDLIDDNTGNKFYTIISILGFLILAYFYLPYEILDDGGLAITFIESNNWYIIVGKLVWSVGSVICILFVTRMLFKIPGYLLSYLGKACQRMVDFIAAPLDNPDERMMVTSKGIIYGIFCIMHPMALVLSWEAFRRIILSISALFFIGGGLYVLLGIVWYHPIEIHWLLSILYDGNVPLGFTEKLTVYPKTNDNLGNLIRLTGQAMSWIWLPLSLVSWTLAVIYAVVFCYFIITIIICVPHHGIAQADIDTALRRLWHNIRDRAKKITAQHKRQG